MQLTILFEGIIIESVSLHQHIAQVEGEGKYKMGDV